MVIFVTEFVIFVKTSKWNELEENGFRMEEFQFRPKIVILDTDSILRVKTMYELVK